MDLEQLQEFCNQLPGVAEDIKWEENFCFTVAEKIFCITGIKQEAYTCFKVSQEDFEVLTEREGIEQAPYFAKRQWVVIRKSSALRKKEWEEYVLKSYQLVKSKLPKKVQKQIDESV